jgi:hypothetical protein
MPGTRTTDFCYPPVLFRVIRLLFVKSRDRIDPTDSIGPCARFRSPCEKCGNSSRPRWVDLCFSMIYLRRQNRLPVGNISEGARVFLPEGKEALCNDQFTNLNTPATFSWLDLQEVSQSCPAETLFESRQREVSVSDGAHVPIAGPVAGEVDGRDRCRVQGRRQFSRSRRWH